jgi:tRNA pseudouridine38-40 synthase
VRSRATLSFFAISGSNRFLRIARMPIIAVAASAAMILALPPIRTAVNATRRWLASRHVSRSLPSRAKPSLARIRPPSGARAAEIAASDRRPQYTSDPDAPARETFKRKAALYIGYDGAAYSGFQRNEGVVAVSDVLENALHAAGAISDDNRGALSKISWVVAARTDKGVSAAGNVVSLKAAFPRSAHAESGNQCEVGSIQLPKSHNCVDLDLAAFAARVNAALPPDVRVFGAAKPTASFSAKDACGGRKYEYLLPKSALVAGTLEEYATILAQYVGSHTFHNFTVGKEHQLPPPPQARRNITHCTCTLNSIFLEHDGVRQEYIRVFVQGDSFQLHQIRKMIALSVMVQRRMVPSDSIRRALDRDVLVNIAPAPAVGLYLDSVSYDAYNKRHADALDEPIGLSEGITAAREKFKLEHIYPSIVRRAAVEDSMAIWFNTVEAHPPGFANEDSLQEER